MKSNTRILLEGRCMELYVVFQFIRNIVTDERLTTTDRFSKCTAAPHRTAYSHVSIAEQLCDQLKDGAAKAIEVSAEIRRLIDELEKE